MLSGLPGVVGSVFSCMLGIRYLYMDLVMNLVNRIGFTSVHISMQISVIIHRISWVRKNLGKGDALIEVNSDPSALATPRERP